MNRTTAPSPGPVRPFHFPAVHRTRLSTGLEVCVAQKRDVPLVTVMLVLDSGEAIVPHDQAGLAVLTGDALEGGTKSFGGEQLARTLEGMGASFGASTGWDSTTVAVSCRAESLAESLVVLSDMVRYPTFPAEEFDRYQAQRLATMAQRAMTPSSLAADHFASRLFRDGDVYGRSVGGTAEAVSVLTPDHARQWVSQRYGSSSAGLVVVGDVDIQDVVKAAEGVFGDWDGGGAPATAPDVGQRSDVRVCHLVDRPGSVQSEIRVGHLGVAKGHPDEVALRVFNVILGGSFTSRLNLNLREKHGFTYGVRSGFAPRRGRGPFSVSTAVGTDVTAAALREVFHEVEKLVEQGPTPEEVDHAKQYMAGVFPLRLETNGRIAVRIAETLVYDLPDDYFETYRDRIRAIDFESVWEAGRRHVHPDQLCTVLVGDADQVEKELPASVGTINRISTEGPAQ